jgi:hypothetical protein
MNTEMLISSIAVILFQTLNNFQEVSVKAFYIRKNDNPVQRYLRISTILLLISYGVFMALLLDSSLSNYLVYWLVLIALGNIVRHLVLVGLRKEGFFYGFPSNILMGVSGIILLIMIINMY